MWTLLPHLLGSFPILLLLFSQPSTVFPHVHVETYVTLDENCTEDEGGTTLAFAFDVTGSMFSELRQFTAGAKRILDSYLKRNDTLLRNFALVPFSDPDIGEITITEDPDHFIRKVNDLYVQGGGDCPEMSITAIYQALSISLPGSFIYVFTDARSKDYELTDKVLKLIQEKESQVVFVVTGDCGSQSHPGFQAYERIAATSSGQIFMMSKANVNQVMTFLEASIQSHQVNLLSMDSEFGATQVHQIAIDSTISRITISVSGDDRQVILRDPNGTNILPLHSSEYREGGQFLQELLAIENVYVVTVSEPIPGMYELITDSHGEHTVRVTAISLLDFAFGFAKEVTIDLSDTSHQPIRGIPTKLMIEALHLNPHGVLDKIEFLNLTGKTIFESRLTRSPTNPDIYMADSTIPPDNYFQIRVIGTDGRNNTFQRITKAAISPLQPDPPRTFTPRLTRGFNGTTAMLVCEVESVVPVDVQWLRHGTPLSEPIRLNETGNVTWTIENADSQIEGLYACVAFNEEGRARSETYLDITEPPPMIATPVSVSVLPSHDAILSCFISNTVEYNITWDKPNTLVSLQSHNRVVLMENGSLVIQSVHPGDAGRYRCKAENEGGVTEEFVRLFVQEPPWINMTIYHYLTSPNQNATLHCPNQGIPTPEIMWFKGDRDLSKVSNAKLKPNGDLDIMGVQDSDAGLYTCVAANDVGRVSQTVTLQVGHELF